MEQDGFDALIAEMEQYSIADLKLILRTQKELYSQEELDVIRNVLAKRKDALRLETAELDFGVTLFCIVGVLTPISGLLTGIIMLIKGSPRWKDAGKKTLLAVLISVIIRVFLYSGGFSI